MQAAKDSGTLVEDRIKEILADLCELAVDAWLPSGSESEDRQRSGGSSLEEAPTKAWLKGYLGSEATSGIYAAWAQEDRVWSIFTYFCW